MPLGGTGYSRSATLAPDTGQGGPRPLRAHNERMGNKILNPPMLPALAPAWHSGDSPVTTRDVPARFHPKLGTPGEAAAGHSRDVVQVHEQLQGRAANGPVPGVGDLHGDTCRGGREVGRMRPAVAGSPPGITPRALSRRDRYEL